MQGKRSTELPRFLERDQGRCWAEAEVGGKEARLKSLLENHHRVDQETACGHVGRRGRAAR